MKLRGIQVSEAVCRLLYRTRLAEVAREALPIVRLALSSVWHVGCDVHQSDNRWIHPSFRNYGSPITVSDKKLYSERDALGFALRARHRPTAIKRCRGTERFLVLLA